MLFWLLMPFYSWAISLEDIQSHPERYVKMDESRSCINYIDAESIHSLRCDPPYYTLLGDVYYVGRSDNLIFKVTEVFCYDYQRSRRELAKSIQLRDRNISYDQLNKAIFKELIQNTGIVGSVISEKAYNTAGTFLQDVATNKFMWGCRHEYALLESQVDLLYADLYRQWRKVLKRAVHI